MSKYSKITVWPSYFVRFAQCGQIPCKLHLDCNGLISKIETHSLTFLTQIILAISGVATIIFYQAAHHIFSPISNSQFLIPCFQQQKQVQTFLEFILFVICPSSSIKIKIREPMQVDIIKLWKRANLFISIVTIWFLILQNAGQKNWGCN